MRAALVLCLLPGMAVAELPPQYQRQAEMGAIITSNAVDAALANEPIEMIRLTKTDVYVVRSARCKVNVAIVDTPRAEEIVGAREFTVEIINTTC
jgi:hypothetical protein